MNDSSRTAFEGQPTASIEQVLQHMTEEFAEQFHGVFARETIDRCVHESYMALYRTATVKVHLANLSYRFTRDRLTALAQSQGSLPKDVPEVLFVCVHNAGRSQMAAALLNHHAHGRVHVRSAGSMPADAVNPAVAQVLDELGLDIGREFPKPLTDDVARAADVLVTMGCGDACPVFRASATWTGSSTTRTGGRRRRSVASGTTSTPTSVRCSRNWSRAQAPPRSLPGKPGGGGAGTGSRAATVRPTASAHRSAAVGRRPRRAATRGPAVATRPPTVG